MFGGKWPHKMNFIPSYTYGGSSLSLYALHEPPLWRSFEAFWWIKRLKEGRKNPKSHDIFHSTASPIFPIFPNFFMVPCVGLSSNVPSLVCNRFIGVRFAWSQKLAPLGLLFNFCYTCPPFYYLGAFEVTVTQLLNLHIVSKYQTLDYCMADRSVHSILSFTVL